MIHALALVLALALPPLSAAFTVLKLHPQGTVRSPRAIRAVFSEPMVPFGDPRGLEPFEVKCSTPGKGLWEDPRTWVYQFPEELSAGESCQLVAKAGLRSEKGSGWEGRAEFAFDTGGPTVTRSEPAEGSVVEQRPAFLLYLDGPADPASVGKHVYLLVEGLPERIPVRVLQAKLRDEIAARAGRYAEYAEGEGAAQGKKPVFVALESTRPLPADKRIQLVWGTGIRAPGGRATTKDKALAFRTEKELTATFQCQRESEGAACLPIGEMSLRFSAGVPRKLAEKAVLQAGGKVIARPEDLGKDDSVSYLRFRGPFPPNAVFSLHVPPDVKDDAGRVLANASRFPLEVRTGGYPPLAKFPAAFGIVEAADPVLPVTLRGLEEKLSGARLEGRKVSLGPDDPVRLMSWVFRLRARHDNYVRWEKERQIDLRGDSLLGREKARQSFELPRPGGTGAFEVVGIPLREKGFHLVEIESRLLGGSLLGKPAPMYVAAGALVTDLAVHLQWGAEGSLVWVTSLSEGKPVAGAKVRAVDCVGKVVWEGRTGGDGVALAAALPSREKAASCPAAEGSGFASGLVVLAEKGGDFSFVYSGWDNGIENWRFQVPTGDSGAEVMAHTVLDRPLFRAGQTVHMKHFLRERFLKGIRYSREQMPRSLVLLHSSGRKIVMPLRFSGSGAAVSEWKIPQEAELGTYSIYLASRDEKAAQGGNGQEEGFQAWGPGVYQSGSFRLEEFRVPVLAGSLQWPKGPLVGAADVSVDLSMRFLSGGGAAGLPVLLRARAAPLDEVSFPDFEGIRFANGGVRLGRSSLREGEASREKKEKAFPDQRLVLDEGGAARASVKGLPGWDQPIRLFVEAEYRDPNGEVQSVGRSVVSYPASALLGIQPEGWVAQKDNVRFQVAVVSPEGKPLPGRKVAVRWVGKESYSHRKRLVGGFYAYENFEETRDKGPACEGMSDARGLLACESRSPASGSMILVASLDEGGRKSRAHHEIYVAGEDEGWFSQENDDRIDLLPEKKAYEPGENARFQVRSPFRRATALVTVEREGVIDRFVTEVDGKSPVLEVPMKESYAPNVFVSALIVRGRVGEPKATALVDLARPAYKLGLAEVRVGWKAHRLDVSVETDKPEYRVREKARVKVRVARALDGKPAAKGEVLVLAVDEALLELMPNESWNLLGAMMSRRPLQVQAATAQGQVVGKRHFGLKALPPGGGGGQASGSTRELFDTLLFWRAALPLSASGEAETEIPLNDSLSRFRVMAIASEEADRFGTGARSVVTRQDLMLFSGVAPLARYGDRTNPEVTVRNAGDRPLRAEVQASAGGSKLGSQVVELAPGASRALSWPQTVPAGGAQQAFEFTATAGAARDALRVTQRLEPALRETMLQAALERVGGKVVFPVERAKGSLPGGSVTVRLGRTLAADLDAVRRYMGDYPFGCLEQKVSQAVALRDRARWKAIAASLSTYVDGAGLLKYFPEAMTGSEVLTAYVLSIANEAGYAVPESELRRMLTGLQGFVNGTAYHAGFTYPAADLSVRKLAAMEALSRHQSFDPAMLGLIQVEPGLWPMRALLDWRNLLRRERGVPDRDKRLAEAEQALLSRIEWRGTVLSFRGSAPLWWLMSSEDEDASRLLLSASDDESWKDDIGRLARGVVARQRQGHWDLTTANAWGVLAMERFSERHEKEAVTGVSGASLSGKALEARWEGGKSPPALSFPWPPAKAELAVSHKGGGMPWALLEARAAVRLSEPIWKGYVLRRSIAPVAQRVKGHWSVGDVYRVTLEVDAPSEMTWVALSDPIPAGSTVLGSGLGGDSAALARGERRAGAAWGAYEERGFSGYRAYQEFVPQGKHRFEYTVRLNAAGTFQMPNSRVEAMYAPEMYAEVPNAPVVVRK